MQDRLASLLTWFELRARVFQTGPLCHSESFDARSGLSYIHVMRRGAMRVETTGCRPVPVERPSLVFYMTPVTHRLVPSADGAETVCASFEFGAGLRNPLIEALPEVVLLALADTPALAATLEVLFEEASEQHCGRQAVLDRLSEVVIIQLLRDLMDQGRLQSGLLAGLADPRLAKAINAMHAQPSHPWNLEQLAATAAMSRARFAASFRDTVGTPPMTYLTAWRLGLSQSLLRQGKSVQAVADEVGYANASALSRAFAALTGLSPTEWRKQDTART